MGDNNNTETQHVSDTNSTDTNTPTQTNESGGISPEAIEQRNKIVNLAQECAESGRIVYSHENKVSDLSNISNGKGKIYLDCSGFVSALYTTYYKDKGFKYANCNGLSKFGKELKEADFKDSDGNIDISKLRPGDILLMDYGCDGVYYKTDPPGPNRAGIYEHTMVYIGDGKYIDTATKGCSINTSAGINANPPWQEKDINHLSWKCDNYTGPLKDSIISVIRIIQDDGSVLISR